MKSWRLSLTPKPDGLYCWSRRSGRWLCKLGRSLWQWDPNGYHYMLLEPEKLLLQE